MFDKKQYKEWNILSKYLSWYEIFRYFKRVYDYKNEEELSQELKNQLDEKDKEIVKLKKEQLYKEDFKKMITTSYSSKDHTSFTTWELKDNSLYDKLPSKEDKTCI
ncbi:hypothetical protein [Spiroplasma endosymbiont of Ammophila pubescens]|uniref:hypothetical protein n=1 Tax=Spiroplasma endosymbiont of Ammophila pubescens TaxID=3066315 RepID=UPI0032B15E8D